MTIFFFLECQRILSLPPKSKNFTSYAESLPPAPLNSLSTLFYPLGPRRLTRAGCTSGRGLEEHWQETGGKGESEAFFTWDILQTGRLLLPSDPLPTALATPSPRLEPRSGTSTLLLPQQDAVLHDSLWRPSILPRPSSRFPLSNFPQWTLFEYALVSCWELTKIGLGVDHSVLFFFFSPSIRRTLPNCRLKS